jgi:hypothetical protein
MWDGRCAIYDSPGEAAAKLMSTQAEMLATLREAGHVMRSLCAMVRP